MSFTWISSFSKIDYSPEMARQQARPQLYSSEHHIEQWEQRSITPTGNGTEKTEKGCNYFTLLCTFLEEREKNKVCTIRVECRQPKNSRLSENNHHITQEPQSLPLFLRYQGLAVTHHVSPYCFPPRLRAQSGHQSLLTVCLPCCYSCRNIGVCVRVFSITVA